MKINNSDNAHSNIIEKLMGLSAQEFKDLGADGLGYIRPLDNIMNGSEPLYSLHSANGSHIATGDNMEILLSIALDHHMIPMTLQ